MRSLLKPTVFAVPLIGFLLTVLAACTPHERFHHTLGKVHDDFHRRPYTLPEHRRLHENLQDLHEDYHEHDRGSRHYYDGRYYPYGY